MLFNQISPNKSECDGFMYISDVVPALYFLMFPIALSLNGVAAWVFLQLKSTSTFVVYLKNLIAADLIMTFVMPITAASDLQQVQEGSTILFLLSCYVQPIFYAALYTCVCLLGLISLDRFFKIMAPQSKLFTQNLTLSKLISGSVWVILFGCAALPNIILSNKSPSSPTQITTCMNLKGPVGLEFHEATVIYLSVVFWIISVVIVVCYVCITNKVIQSSRNSGSNNKQGKQRIKLRVFFIVIVFFISFGPYHMLRIPYTYLQVNSSTNEGCFHLRRRFVKEFSLWFSTTNTCMNPLLYIFLCREFKEKLMLMMKNVSFSFQVASGTKAGPE